MKFTELKKKTADELDKELARLDFELMKYRAQIATGGVGKESGKVREMRKTIARIRTIRNQEVPAKQ